MSMSIRERQAFDEMVKKVEELEKRVGVHKKSLQRINNRITYWVKRRGAPRAIETPIPLVPRPRVLRILETGEDIDYTDEELENVG